MLAASLRHRALLIRVEEKGGRAVANQWLRAGSLLESVVRKCWPSGEFNRQVRYQMAQQIDQVLMQSTLAIMKDLQGWLLALADREHRWAIGMLDRSIPDAVWGFVGGPSPARRRMFERVEVGLVKPIDYAVARELLDEPIQSMVWDERFEMISTQQQLRLRRTIARGISEGEGVPEVIRRVKSGLGWGATRAALVARTEVHHVSNLVHDRVYRENRQVLNGVECVATLDERCCIECGALDGMTYWYEPGAGQHSIDDAPMYPLHPRCRCVKTPITKWAEMLGITEPTRGMRASMDGPVPETQKFKTWIRQQPAGVQDTVMGKARGLAWRKSGMKGLPRP